MEDGQEEESWKLLQEEEEEGRKRWRERIYSPAEAAVHESISVVLGALANLVPDQSEAMNSATRVNERTVNVRGPTP